MSRFLSRRFATLTPYTPGEQPQNRNYIKLNTNENPYPPAPAVAEAIRASTGEGLKRYPDPTASELIGTMAAYCGVAEEQILFGNGSDEILAFCFLAFCDRDVPACFADITYGFYKVFAGLCAVEAKIIPLAADFSIDPTEYHRAGGTVFIANPNAPTGMALTLPQIADILANNRENLVIVDEAYVDFGAESAVALTAQYDNLLVVGTFSKSRNLAGARLGYAIGDNRLIADLNTIKYSFNPYNVNRLTLAAGKAAIEDRQYFSDCCRKVIETREFTVNALWAMGFTVLPSKANFIFAKHRRLPGEKYYLQLKEKDILVRHFADARICDYVRITIGTREEMVALIETTKMILEERQ